MIARIARAAILGTLLALVAAAPVAAEEHLQTGVLVSGPPSVEFYPPGYELEMRGIAFTIKDGPGRGSVEGTGDFTVTLRRLDTCAVVVRFTARPGQNYQVNSNLDGTFRVDESRGLDGPGLTGHEPRCAALPDTSLRPDAAPAGWPGAAIVMALGAMTGVFVGVRVVAAGGPRP